MTETWTGHAELAAADLREPGFAAAGIASAAWSARVEPDATRNLVRAAMILTQGEATAACCARTGPCPGDYTFLAAVSELEGELMGQLARCTDMAGQCEAALGAAAREHENARSAADAARTRMCIAANTKIYAAAEADFSAAVQRMEAALPVIADCEAAMEILAAACGALDAALTSVRAVPEDMGEVYEIPYQHLRSGGTLPASGDFLTGGISREAA